MEISAGTFVELAEILKARLSGPGYAALMGDNVRIALDQTLAEMSWAELCASPASLSGLNEIAFLPPVTGG